MIKSAPSRISIATSSAGRRSSRSSASTAWPIGSPQTNIEFVKDRLSSADGEAIARLTREARIRLALTELGPTFIKLGQLLSTRPDVVGQGAGRRAEAAASRDAGRSAETVAQKIVETELGQPLDELFAEFDLAPIASASIGQVHRARLNTGERVVVKVQHAGIDTKVNEDLEVLAGLAQLAEQFPEFAPYRPTANVAEMGRTLRRELDFGREERNLHQFAELFRDDPTVSHSQAYTELSTPRVLTMDMIDGIPLSQPGLLEAAGLDREEVARRGANLYLEMIFTHGFFHADPHPGNIVLAAGQCDRPVGFRHGRPDRRAAAGRHRRHADGDRAARCAAARADHQADRQPPPQLDEAGLANDVADFVGHYATQASSTFDVGAALTDMIEIIRRYRIMLPPQVAMLIKTLVTLEGTAKLLSPRFSLMEVMQPFQRGMMLRRLSPARQAKKLRRLYLEVEQLVEVLPQRIIQILEQVQDGKFDVHLDHRGLGPSVNRLVLGMLASALFVGSSFLLSYKVPPLLVSPERSLARPERHFAPRPRRLHRSACWSACGCCGPSARAGTWIRRCRSSARELRGKSCNSGCKRCFS